MRVDERLLQDRFAALSSPVDADWSDVRRRARRRTGKVVVAVLALLVALVAAGLAVGGRVIGLFDVHGKQIPLSSLSERDRETLVLMMCPHPGFRTVPGRAPQPACPEGVPNVEEIANDGSQVHYRIKYPWGLTCLATGRVGGYRSASGNSLIGSLECNTSSRGVKLVPTPQRPITVDAVVGSRAAHPGDIVLLRLSGLAGEGVARVALVAPAHSRVSAPVRDHAYSFKNLPVRAWRSIVALDPAGHEVYREKLFGYRPPPPPAKPHRPPPPPPPRHPVGSPLQAGATPDAAVAVYRNFVVLRFRSTTSEPYARLARSARNVNGHVGLTCARVAYGAGRWQALGLGSNPPLARELKMPVGGVHPMGGSPSPPYDFCEVGGMYGRYWNDEEGTHELVELPLTALGRRYLAERGAARDLAYFVRTKRLLAIRRAIHRGEAAPTAVALAHMFGPRVVPLASRSGAAPTGKIGVWTNGKLIVASEVAPNGRRLFVTMRDVFIGANNIRGLVYVF